jgi:hypothetical protein
MPPLQDWHEAIDLYREESADACAVRRLSSPPEKADITAYAGSLPVLSPLGIVCLAICTRKAQLQ